MENEGKIEAVLLTGGASSRMGRDKAKLLMEGEPLASRIARLLIEKGVSVTVSGREPLDNCGFLADEEEFAGPLAALARFQPSAEFVLVASCDLPGFNAGLVGELLGRIGSCDAAIPEADGRLQPLCGLYRATAFEVARELVGDGERRMMRWLDRLHVAVVDDLDPSWFLNVNTPADLERSGHGSAQGS